jgi:NAD(P)H dehydrogenase (quinone)
VTFLRAPETLPDEVLAKMHAPPKPDDAEATADKLTEYDGIMFGMPTRFGMACAQMKALMDSTGALWQNGALVGKPAGVFFSTAVQNGGQETTGFTFLTQLTHHGMIFVSRRRHSARPNARAVPF